MDTDRLIKRDYRACPESYQKMAKMIQAEEKHTGIYVLAGAQCEDWVDELIKKTDSRKPSKSDPIKQGGLFHLPGSPKHDPRNNPPWGKDIPIFLVGSNLSGNVLSRNRERLHSPSNGAAKCTTLN